MKINALLFNRNGKQSNQSFSAFFKIDQATSFIEEIEDYVLSVDECYFDVVISLLFNNCEYKKLKNYIYNILEKAVGKRQRRS